ncbi:MAG UNVERIFIED_CONTAM: NAD(P)/FAD-dependent oxidoreductase [Rickettsiaceae bacterium]|jgi:predicted Rossmann fold flavoprotein
MKNPNKYDVIVIGAGAAGLMAAWQSAIGYKRVLLIEHTNKIGEKIRISGGGRCNFTNLFASPNNYICQNPHFIKSALAGYSQHDFIKLVESYNIAYHEKTLGQLFCDGSSKQIIDMMLDLCNKNSVEIKMNCIVNNVTKSERFILETSHGDLESEILIIATGALSIPKMGATDFGYRIAKKFGLKIVPTKPALVPLTIREEDKDFFKDLIGISNPSIVSYSNTSFEENILFTHRGLSGPAILQISSYLEKFENEEIIIDLLPSIDLSKQFIIDKNSKKTPIAYLKNYLANRFVDKLSDSELWTKSITDLRNEHLLDIADKIHRFVVKIAGSEGYAKAEVTAGGVNTDELSSKNMESKKVPGLFFIGEVVDVTGWLGGYNFQWAWSSGFAAGQAVR